MPLLSNKRLHDSISDHFTGKQNCQLKYQKDIKLLGIVEKRIKKSETGRNE